MIPTAPASPELEHYRGRRALVLGGSGFIGAWVARALSARGARVHISARDAAVARRRLDRDPTEADIHQVTFERPGSVAALIEDIRPDVVFNLVVHGVDQTERDVSLMTRLNAEVPAEVCAALVSVRPPASWAGARLVHAGSALEYGAAPGHLSEETVPQPTTDYGRTKLQGTDAVTAAGHSQGLRGVVARLFTVYGPGEHPGRLLPSIRDAARGADPLPLTDGLQRRDFTYVGEVVEGLLRLGACTNVPPGAVVNVATGRLVSVREFTEVAARTFGVDSARLQFGALPTRASEMCHDDVDVSRLRELVSWTPTLTITQGLQLSKQSDDV